MQTQLRQAVVVAFGRTPYCKARTVSYTHLTLPTKLEV